VSAQRDAVGERSDLVGADNDSVSHHRDPVGARSQAVGAHSYPVCAHCYSLGAHCYSLGAHCYSVGMQSYPVSVHSDRFQAGSEAGSAMRNRKQAAMGYRSHPALMGRMPMSHEWSVVLEPSHNAVWLWIASIWNRICF
jgi:hypothetical protein